MSARLTPPTRLTQPERRTRLGLLRPLARHELHAARTLPLVCGTVLGVAVCAAPTAFGTRTTPATAAVLLYLAAVFGSLGLLFLLDDPAAPSTAVSPLPWWLRRAVRAAAGLLVLAVAWSTGAALVRRALPEGERAALPLADLAGVAPALGLLALALALCGLRLTAGRNGSLVGAPAFIVLTLILVLLPSGWEFFASPGDGGWNAAMVRWRVMGAASLVAALVLIRKPDPVAPIPGSAPCGDVPPAARPGDAIGHRACD
ncbi:hypothetical protein [Streptomyces boncukensis]|uniref:ABC transporter n=1 Tax=Streptomyces boncukensis TaxID=2711219 RepID=A0A6G4X078_9ACTN|nr:hypothetical protein [Streptomyces boncukensis]NGO70154.1 hypothetical protein [Streptomyces boncukensis]